MTARKLGVEELAQLEDDSFRKWLNGAINDFSEEELKVIELHSAIKVHPDVFAILWIRFSDIQLANRLTLDVESIEKFNEWVTSGKDIEAWS